MYWFWQQINWQGNTISMASQSCEMQSSWDTWQETSWSRLSLLENPLLCPHVDVHFHHGSLQQKIILRTCRTWWRKLSYNFAKSSHRSWLWICFKNWWVSRPISRTLTSCFAGIEPSTDPVHTWRKINGHGHEDWYCGVTEFAFSTHCSIVGTAWTPVVCLLFVWFVQPIESHE